MNAHLEDDIFDDDRHHHSHRSRRDASRARRPKRRGRTAVALLLAVAVIAGGGYLAFGSLRGIVPSFGSDAVEDFAGPGAGQVEITVEEGATGSDIGSALEEAGVVKSSGAFVQAAAAEPDKAAKIQPGTYELKKEMKASDAFTWLADNANRVAQGVTIPEGLWAIEIYERLSKATKIPVARYEAAATSEQLKLPTEAGGSIEGWLFPSTYEFPKDSTPVQQLDTMIAKTQEELQKADVPRARWERTLTVASIVEGESGAADRGKVARVVENRLADPTGPTVGMLQMDSTIHYLLKKRGTITTSDKERESDSPYNTYKNKGLPPGPINNPGAAAIEAAADPEPGKWIFFVTVDPDTGETKFATTTAQHERNVQEFCRNTGSCE
ncbi:endolytic transglycosylase MltG [Janibacter sp. UYMM211]|jgi:UPF0755 protein|uniref:endolytic transglycosylase MltG n=1 Tax=Janibacter sp. UYMM211 TaxID=3156342 RepID=UPI0033995498